MLYLWQDLWGGSLLDNLGRKRYEGYTLGIQWWCGLTDCPLQTLLAMSFSDREVGIITGSRVHSGFAVYATL